MDENNAQTTKRYILFFVMIAVSMLLMYLTTYLNSAQILNHFWFSETRSFMTLIMGSVMMAVMLAFMWKMYPKKGINIAILVLAVLLFTAGVWLVRSQMTVSDVDYMEGMIPHHSIAILTSERSQIEDPRVRQLADEIIKAQRREIKEMEWLIRDIQTNGVAESSQEAEQRPVPEFSGLD